MQKQIIFILFLFVSIFAEGSREQDSLALVAIQEANPELKNKWDYTKPLEDCPSATIKNNRVVSLSYYSNTGLTIIPDEIGMLSSLQKVFIMGASLKSISKEIGKLTSLKDITLNATYLHFLPKEIAQLEPEKLSVGNNLISKYSLLPEVITWLDTYDHGWEDYQSCNEISRYKIKINLLYIPSVNSQASLNWNIIDSITTWEGVTYDSVVDDIIFLKLSKKKLTTIPDSIHLINRLSELDFSWNEIKTIPTTFGQFKYLRNFNLSHNDISLLPEEITQLTPTNGLDMGYNNLKEMYLTNEQITWLDTYDPDWRTTQGIDAIVQTKNNSLKPIRVSLKASTLYLSESVKSPAKLSIFSMNGKEVFQTEIKGRKVVIPVLSKGMYVVKVASEYVQFSQKIVVE